MTRSTLFRILAAALLAMSIFPLDAADMTGKWDMVWDTEGGVRRTVWEVRQEGEKVTVDTDGSKLTGTIKDNQFAVEGSFYSAEAGYNAPLKVSGSLEGDALNGKGSWDQYSMSFTASRAK